MAERRICVVTGSRAEYGLLSWLMTAIQRTSELALQVAVTGSHLEPRFGDTWREIVADGFPIDARIPLGLDDDTPQGVTAALGRATVGFGEAFARLRPDVVVVLGDRFEILAAAQATLLARLPLAHIHGGELTEGAVDDAIRHAITKMAHLHFTACGAYARRVIQLGEPPERVFEVGALGAEAVANTDYENRAVLEAELGLTLDAPLLLVTYHPATLGRLSPEAAIGALLAALEKRPATRIVFTGVNADPGRDAVDRPIRAFVADRPGRTVFRESLGQRRYLSAMRLAAAVVGNSSSGVIEAPTLGVPVVNIGDRQKGRLRAASVIDCAETEGDILAALDKALDPAFRDGLAGIEPPFGRGGAAARIAGILATTDLTDVIHKTFHDLPQAA